jgi:hypothetical protein
LGGFLQESPGNQGVPYRNGARREGRLLPLRREALQQDHPYRFSGPEIRYSDPHFRYKTLHFPVHLAILPGLTCLVCVCVSRGGRL